MVNIATGLTFLSLRPGAARATGQETGGKPILRQ